MKAVQRVVRIYGWAPRLVPSRCNKCKKIAYLLCDSEKDAEKTLRNGKLYRWLVAQRNNNDVAKMNGDCVNGDLVKAVEGQRRWKTVGGA